MNNFLKLCILIVGRLCLLPSFLLACLFSPIVMFSSIADWPEMAADMWDDPF